MLLLTTVKSHLIGPVRISFGTKLRSLEDIDGFSRGHIMQVSYHHIQLLTELRSEEIILSSSLPFRSRIELTRDLSSRLLHR